MAATSSHSFMITPPWTKPAELASVGPSEWTRTACECETGRGSMSRGIPSRLRFTTFTGGHRGRHGRTYVHRHQGEDQQAAGQGRRPGRDARVLLPAPDGAA